MVTIQNNRKSSKVITLALSLGFIIVFIISLVLASVPVMMLPGGIPSLYYGIWGTAGAFLTAALFLRLKKEKLASIGLVWERLTIFRFIIGMGIGCILFFFVIGFVMILGGGFFKPVQTIHYRELLLGLLPVLPLALMEEIGFRSYPLVKLEREYGIWTAQVIIAVAFAFYHMLNGWGIAVSFYGPFVWSFVFVLAAIRSKGIAVPTGIHFSLNIMQNLAGMKNNGNPLFTIAYKNEVNQYVGISVHLLVLFLACIATQIYVKKRKRMGEI